MVHDVPRDPHCGYYALLRSLHPIFPDSEEAAIDYRKNYGGSSMNDMRI
jgi:hypothetical protein